MTAMASQIISITIVYSTVYSDPDQRKYQSAASLAFVRFPTQRASNVENVSIWWRHHAKSRNNLSLIHEISKLLIADPLVPDQCVIELCVGNPLIRHRGEGTWRCHDMEMLSTLLAFCVCVCRGWGWGWGWGGGGGGVGVGVGVGDQQCQWQLMFSLVLARTSCATKSQVIDDFKRYESRVSYDVTLIFRIYGSALQVIHRRGTGATFVMFLLFPSIR